MAAPTRHPATGRFLPKPASAPSDLGPGFNPAGFPPSQPITQPPSPGSATLGQTGGIFQPAQSGSSGGANQAPHRLRPAAVAPKGAGTTP
jgi:hypothetical protein